MNFITIDLGTTNIKVSAYDEALEPLAVLSEAVVYDRDRDFVEFDCDAYFRAVAAMIREAAAAGKRRNDGDAAQIILTGQAESLILLGGGGEPVHPAISWLDMRSRRECGELAAAFPKDICYRITGQPELIPTWPVTKMLWLRRNKTEIFDRTEHFLLLKDYIIYRLTGRMLGDYSIYSFSHYFDIAGKCFWKEILDYVGVDPSKLPEVAPPCTIAGGLLAELADGAAGLTAGTRVNVGTLDHFAGMIGTGNTREGIVGESAGTVLSIAALTREPDFENGTLPVNCGPFPDSYVLLPVCESGGFSMEWYKRAFLPEMGYPELDRTVEERRKTVIPPVFLPYLTGVNPPDFNADASGVFFGLRPEHDAVDCARAVMEGVACLLKKNIDYMEAAGVAVDKIISTGGGAKSAVWTQIKADLTGRPVEVPENEEAPSLGAAIIGAVSEGCFPSFEAAVKRGVRIGRRFEPGPLAEDCGRTAAVFEAVYAALEEAYRMDARRRSVNP